MALDSSGLGDAIEAWFLAPEDDIAGNAAVFAAAMEGYAEDIVPASSAVSSAAGSLEAALVTAMGASDAAATATALEAAFLAFATAVGAGMAGFTPVPPPSPLGWAGLLAARPDTAEDAAANWAEAIDTWMQTGTATPAGGGAPVTWS